VVLRMVRVVPGVPLVLLRVRRVTLLLLRGLLWVVPLLRVLLALLVQVAAVVLLMLLLLLLLLLLLCVRRRAQLLVVVALLLLMLLLLLQWAALGREVAASALRGPNEAPSAYPVATPATSTADAAAGAALRAAPGAEHCVPGPGILPPHRVRAALVERRRLHLRPGLGQDTLASAVAAGRAPIRTLDLCRFPPADVPPSKGSGDGKVHGPALFSLPAPGLACLVVQGGAARAAARPG